MRKQLSEINSKFSHAFFNDQIITLYQNDLLLKRAFDIHTKDGEACLLIWLILNENRYKGLNIYEFIRKFQNIEKILSRTITIPNTSIKVPAVIYSVWKMRDDLRLGHNLKTEEHVSKMFSILIVEYPFIQLNLHIFSAYLQKINTKYKIPELLVIFWLSRPDLNSTYNLNNKNDLIKVTSSLIHDNIFSEIGIPLLNDFLFKPFKENISLIILAIRNEREDIQSAFNIMTETGKTALLNWFNSNYVTEYPWLSQNPKTNSVLFPTTDDTPKASNNLINGVNLIGYPYSSSGIGTDLRMVAKGLEEAKIPFCVIETPVETPAPRNEKEFKKYEAQAPLYNTTLICLPCSELYKTFTAWGEDFFKGQYLIGQMPWELSNWPVEQIPILDLIDEAWSLSSFIHSSLETVFSNKIHYMPRSVEINTSPKANKNKFNIPNDSFSFLFTYDGLSTSSRKNPTAILEAFSIAFNDNPKAHLVIKTMNGSHDPFIQSILDKSNSLNNISVINQVLSKDELFSLFKSCDAYISLHRSEGFGLTIAEAMLLDIPVITSNYSGNTDFCNKNTSLLVNGKLIPLKDGEYFSTDNQKWFDADVKHAASQMTHCFKNRFKLSSITNAAKEKILKDYSISRTSRNYKNRLKSIWKDMKNS